MTERVADRLWPVLLVLFALLFGAVVIEQYAKRRGNGEVRIALKHEGEAVVAVDDDDDATPSSAATLSTTPISAGQSEARALARRGELAGALELYRREVEAHQDSADLRFELGFWLLSEGKVPEAQAELIAAQALAPRDPRIALFLGQAKLRAGDLAGAEEEISRALDLRPAYGSARLALGQLLAKRGANERAIEILKSATESGGNIERARVSVALGQVLLGMKKSADAERAFEQAIFWAPAQAELRVAIARAYLTLEGKESAHRAAELLMLAAELAPDLAQVFSTLGRARERLGETNEAKLAYERALRLDPENRFVSIRLLRLALARRDFQNARAMAKRLVDSGPEIPENHFLAGLSAARSGKLDEARASYGEAIARAKGAYPEAYFNLGLLEKRAKKYDRAIAAYSKALELRPDYLAARNNLGLAQAAAGRIEDAERAYREAIARDEKYAAAWLNLGELLSDAKRYPQAIEALEHAIAVKPDYDEARLDLGVVHARAGDVEAAISAYRALLERRPRYVSAAYNLALALDGAGRSVEALNAYRRVLELDPDHVAALTKLAALDAQLGAVDEAKSAYEDLLERNPNDYASRIMLAEMLARGGDSEGCRREAKLVLTSVPEEARARALVERCASERSSK